MIDVQTLTLPLPSSIRTVEENQIGLIGESKQPIPIDHKI
jgi:hypothetical protein